MSIDIHPRSLRRIFALAIGSLLLIHVSIVIARLNVQWEPLKDLRLLFDFDEEHNVPTLYSSFALMVCSMLLTWIGRRHQLEGESHRYWYGLALTFGFLALDEVVQLHERIDQVRSGVLASWRVSGWILPYAAALAALGLGYARFLLRLPLRHRVWFLAAGAIFVFGTVGCELLGPFAQRRGRACYAVCYTCEELFEMSGVAVFVLGLVDYAIARFGALTLSIRSGA